MSYQAWEDLLEDGDEPSKSKSGLGVASPKLDQATVLQQVPALAELMRQRSELEQHMASLLGGNAADGRDAERERLRLGAPPSTAAERAAARRIEADDIARRESARLRAAERRFRDETEALRREGLADRGKRQLSAQQRRLEDAARRRLEHGLELAEQRYLPEGAELRQQASKAADAIDKARAPLADWKNQRQSLRTQLSDQIAQAKTDPELQEALRDDPTALDGIDEELDKALAIPDAWVERADNEAQKWSERLRSPDTWGDRDRRLTVDRVVDGIEQLERLRQAGRERAEDQRKDQRKDDRKDDRKESRRDARRRERKAARDDSDDGRRRQASTD